MPPYISARNLELTRVSRSNTTHSPVGSTCNIDAANIVESNDTLQYACSIRPTVDAFKYSFFFRTVLEWNKVPHKIRQNNNNGSFSVLLKEHLWKVLLEKPD